MTMWDHLSPFRWVFNHTVDSYFCNAQVSETSLYKHPWNHRTVRKCAACMEPAEEMWSESMPVVRGQSPENAAARGHVEKQEPALDIQYSKRVGVRVSSPPLITQAHRKM